MVEVSRAGDDIVFQVKGLHKLWAFKSQLRIPRAHIRRVRQDADVLKGWWKGLRLPGTHIPGLFAAGTFYQDSRRIFWDVYRPENALLIDLTHDDYDQLIIEVDNPAAVLALLQAG
jgi:hypothetical protein